MMRAPALTLLLFLLSVGIPEDSFPQTGITGEVHLGALYIDTRQDIDMAIGGKLIHKLTSNFSLELNIDWVNLEGLSAPEDRFDYNALYYDGALFYRSDHGSTEYVLGTGIGAATFLLHDVTTTDEGTDTKPKISLIAGVEWHPGGTSSTGFRFEIRDNVVLGNKDGLVDEARSTTHSIGVSAGVLFDL